MRSSVTRTFLAVLACACQPEVDDGDLTDAYATSTFIKPPRPLGGTDGLLMVGNELWVALTINESVVVIDPMTGATKRVIADEDEPDATELVTPDDFWRDPLTGDIYISQVGDLLGGHVDRIAPNGTRTRILNHFRDVLAFPNGIAGFHRPGEPPHVYIAPVEFFGNKTGIFEIDPNGLIPPILVYGAQAGIDIFGQGLRGGGNGMEFDAQGVELFTPVTFGGAVLAIDVANHTARTVWNGNGGNSRAVYVRFTPDRTALLYNEHSTGKLLRLDPYGPPDQVPQLVAQLDRGIDGMAFRSDGKVLVSNFITGGISVVDPNTGSVQQLVTRSMNTPEGIAILPDGKLLIGDTASLSVVDPQAPPSQLPFRPKFFIDGDVTVGVAAAGACDVYVTTLFKSNIQHYNLCAAVPNQATDIVPMLTMGFPNDLVLVGQNLYVCDGAGVVWRLAVNGANPAVALPFATGLARPTGIAHRDGKIYVSQNSANRVDVFDAALGLPVRTITGVDSPEGLAVEPDGSVLVLESNLGRLVRIQPNGARTTIMTGLGTRMRGIINPLISVFADTVLTADGDVIVTEPLTGAVRRIDL